MKKKILSATLAVVMLFSVTTMAFADNSKSNHSDKNKNKVKIEVKKEVSKKHINKKHINQIKKEIREVQLKIKITKRQIANWTAKKIAIEKKIAENTTVVNEANKAELALYVKLLADAEVYYKAAIAHPGLTADQIAIINKVYNAGKKILTAKIARLTNLIANRAEYLQKALAQANSKIEKYNKNLVRLNAKLVLLKAKICVPKPTPTVVPVV